MSVTVSDPTPSGTISEGSVKLYTVTSPGSGSHTTQASQACPAAPAAGSILVSHAQRSSDSSGPNHTAHDFSAAFPSACENSEALAAQPSDAYSIASGFNSPLNPPAGRYQQHPKWLHPHVVPPPALGEGSSGEDRQTATSDASVQSFTGPDVQFRVDSFATLDSAAVRRGQRSRGHDSSFASGPLAPHEASRVSGLRELLTAFNNGRGLFVAAEMNPSDSGRMAGVSWPVGEGQAHGSTATSMTGMAFDPKTPHDLPPEPTYHSPEVGSLGSLTRQRALADGHTVQTIQLDEPISFNSFMSLSSFAQGHSGAFPHLTAGRLSFVNEPVIFTDKTGTTTLPEKGDAPSLPIAETMKPSTTAATHGTGSRPESLSFTASQVHNDSSGTRAPTPVGASPRGSGDTSTGASDNDKTAMQKADSDPVLETACPEGLDAEPYAELQLNEFEARLQVAKQEEAMREKLRAKEVSMYLWHSRNEHRAAKEARASAVTMPMLLNEERTLFSRNLQARKDRMEKAHMHNIAAIEQSVPARRSTLLSRLSCQNPTYNLPHPTNDNGELSHSTYTSLSTALPVVSTLSSTQPPLQQLSLSGPRRNSLRESRRSEAMLTEQENAIVNAEVARQLAARRYLTKPNPTGNVYFPDTMW